MTAQPKTTSAVDASVPVLDDVDPFDEEVLAGPHHMHSIIRDAGDLVYLAQHDIYAVARYSPVRETLENWQDFSSAAGAGLANFRYEEPWRPPSLLLEADPPHHDAPRSVLQKILGPRRIRAFEDEWDRTANQLVDCLLEYGERDENSAVVIDAVPSIAEPFPLSVFPEALGLSGEGLDNLLPYGNFAFNAFGPRNRLVTEAQKTIGPVMEWVGEQCPRHALTESGLGADIWAASDDTDITEAQAPLIVRSLLTAGVDTTVYGIAAVLYHLADNPDQYQRLRDEPELIRAAIEESLRLESPVQTFFRTTTRDVPISGHVIPEGKKVLMFLGAANRDPRRWANPDEFDLGRDPSGHVAFGSGIHQCVGQHVARFEAASLLQALVPKIERIEFSTAPERKINNTLLGWKTLPLRLIPA
ncbi:MAG: cytochrome P450 [Brevibacterium sp.]|uniref:Cytochrome P450 n=1 Tax=Brevibacterium aurantiacum TaxID=273384 RepID=A0A2H1IZ22_BREAU|nr:cytochrome P450 [Brevibacterium aurantiacum]GEB23664.1 cytochrome P450 [Brevibacterium aurantiacum]SMX80427.1 Cytochrome P450 [Brevibacterium aurantiacum]SMX95755.1 Cytochrome P450 [Brevibacterium aurantiacum]